MSGFEHALCSTVLTRIYSGYAADFSSAGFLSSYRPDLLELPTTNSDHSTGDGHRLATSVSASLIDMDQVQVHPTGFIDPANPDAKTKFLAAEALRGVGGLLVDGKGRRFVNEVERRDFVTEKMQKVIAAGDGPVRLILNEESYQELKAHCTSVCWNEFDGMILTRIMAQVTSTSPKA